MADENIQETPGPSPRGRTDHDLLILIWERLGTQAMAIKEIQHTLRLQDRAIVDEQERLDGRYVPRVEWRPYRVTLDLIGVAVVLGIVGAVLYLVIRGGPAGHTKAPDPPAHTRLAGDAR